MLSDSYKRVSYRAQMNLTSAAAGEDGATSPLRSGHDQLGQDCSWKHNAHHDIVQVKRSERLACEFELSERCRHCLCVGGPVYDQTVEK